MKFRCSNCNIEWVIPKEKLVYISDWPDACPNCGSADIDHETVEKAIASSAVLENVNDKELEEIKRKNLRRWCKALKREEVKNDSQNGSSCTRRKRPKRKVV